MIVWRDKFQLGITTRDNDGAVVATGEERGDVDIRIIHIVEDETPSSCYNSVWLSEVLEGTS